MCRWTLAMDAEIEDSFQVAAGTTRELFCYTRTSHNMFCLQDSHLYLRTVFLHVSMNN